MDRPVHILDARLDDLAHAVAGWLDDGAADRAWEATRALEIRAGIGDGDDRMPPVPLIARRFAAAHKRLLRGAVGPVAPCAAA